MRPAALVPAGLLLMALSFAAMWWVGAASALLTITAWTGLGRIGLGVVLPSLSLAVLRGMQVQWLAQGVSALNFVRQLGGAVGVSLVGVTLEWRLAAHGMAPDGDISQPAQLEAFHETFLLLSVTMGLAVIVSCRLRRDAARSAPP
jgi:hypothetical protein